MAICITKKMPRWKLVIGIILLMFGKHTLLREITMLETESATIRSRQPVYCQWDGEPWLLPPGEYKLEVLKQVLPVYIPSK
jgi:diacylglycerol kinase family enzyme